MPCVREETTTTTGAAGAEAAARVSEDDRPEGGKKRRFHPLRGLRRMFRRKVRMSGSCSEPSNAVAEATAPGDPSLRSRSTSELLASAEEVPPEQRSGVADGSLFPCPTGLSLSHDSVFTSEGGGGETMESAHSSSSLSTRQLGPGVRAELLDAVRRRRQRPGGSDDDDDEEDEEEEDLGLPRSPCGSPTTADVLLEKGLKELPTQSHSTCSDGSLLSMGSSEMDEDSLGQHSGHSSKLSLHDKKPLQEPADTDLTLDLELRVSAAPLSHSAARHKMAVRPRRTHGVPRRCRRLQQLPATPEVLEETGRSASPEPKLETPSVPAPEVQAPTRQQRQGQAKGLLACWWW